MSAEHEFEPHQNQEDADTVSSDYSYVNATARVAVYDDMKMPPHIIEIKPAPTADFIEHLATCINDEKLKLGGKIPYGAIREVAENFIHARFTEVVVSILDGGNTIRFCDQGPGIESKDKATLPGFTSARGISRMGKPSCREASRTDSVTICTRSSLARMMGARMPLDTVPTFLSIITSFLRSGLPAQSEEYC